VEDSWERIPSPTLDPHSDESIRAAMEAGEPVEPPTLIQLPNGSCVPVDGMRRVHIAKTLRQTELHSNVIEATELPNGYDEFDVVIREEKE
jgi:ParB-like chromosome segregation protein Spo0J